MCFLNSGLNFVTARASRNSSNDPRGEPFRTRIYVTHDKTVEAGPLGPTLLSDTEPRAPNQQEQHLSHKKSSLHSRISSAQSTTQTSSPSSQSRLASAIPHFFNKKPQQSGAHGTNNTVVPVAHLATDITTDMKLINKHTLASNYKINR
jgi:hypothetical protein